jgi:hypothetical protein
LTIESPNLPRRRKGEKADGIPELVNILSRTQTCFR